MVCVKRPLQKPLYTHYSPFITDLPAGAATATAATPKLSPPSTAAASAPKPKPEPVRAHSPAPTPIVMERFNVLCEARDIGNVFAA